MDMVLAYITGMIINNPLRRKGINCENVERLSDNSNCQFMM
jgi:hypothetical protein